MLFENLDESRVAEVALVVFVLMQPGVVGKSVAGRNGRGVLEDFVDGDG